MQIFNKSLVLRVISIFVLILTANLSWASNTGGIFGPVVNEGHKSLQYRNAYDPDNHNFVQRLHYQQAMNDDLMWRGIVQTRKTASSDNDFDFFQAELFWQLENISSDWQQGVRFDARIRDGDRPDQFGFNWMHQVRLSPELYARMLLLSSVQFGSNSSSGVALQSRGSLHYAVDDQWEINLELFNNLGSTGRFNGVSNQTQQVGPSIVGKLGDGWQVFAGVLFGATSVSPDESYRFWLTKSF